MTSFARTDRSELGRWWWTVDRWMLAALIALMGFGVVLILAASPAAAQRIGLSGFQLATRQLLLLPGALLLMFVVSLLTPLSIRRLSVIAFLGALALSLLTLLIGPETKGATRWITLAGFSLQPSEFLKPSFAVVVAWLFATARSEEGFPGTAIALALLLLSTMLLLLQPDVGQVLVLIAVWGVQFFLAGNSLIWVGLLGGAALAGLVGTYFMLPHVALRIDSFLDPEVGDRYQINRSMEAFANGGLIGTGPGEGTVKAQLPDAQSDFIFAVAGEELGLIACLVIVALFAFVVLRGFSRVFHENSLFILLATSGLLTQFGLQALINMASAVRLIPTKGMTLPFISYGGSSLIAVALGMGMVLAFTRKRVFLGEAL